MYETHTEVTGQHIKRERERPAVDALTVRTEHRAERDTDVLVLWLSGALDRATSALLDRELDAQAGHATHVVLDLTGLELIDSAGLQTLVRTHRRAAENGQRTSFRQGPHAGRLPLELTPRHPPALSAGGSPHERQHQRDFLAHATRCAEVAHQRPLVIDHEVPWMGASGQAVRANSALLAFECSWTYAGVDVAWARLAGELDIATAWQLKRTLRESLSRARLVVLDLRKLAFMDSCGVHAIVNASVRAREVGRRLILLRGPPSVDRVFALTCGSDDVEIVDLRSLLTRSEPELAR